MTSNFTKGLGGGIFVDAGVTATLQRAAVSRNIGAYGGGIYNYMGSVGLTGSAVTYNIATSGA